MSNLSHRSERANRAALATLSAAIEWKVVIPLKHPLGLFTDDGSCDHQALLPSLPPADSARAHAMGDPLEQRHFVLRRCFQGLFLKTVMAWPEPIAALGLHHETDCPPRTERAPGLALAFSSSGPTAIAGASLNSAIGIDIERLRPISNVNGLAARFFTAREAATLAHLPEANQAVAFLNCWCAKEAGLKATGRGIVSGLNNFELDFPPGSATPMLHANHDKTWHLHYPPLLEGHVVALVENSAQQHGAA